MKKHILIDGGNILHRAFHVFIAPDLDKQLRSSSGHPTGLIYGPLKFLADWLPSIGCFDSLSMFMDGYPARRRTIDPNYKKRDEPRPSLVSAEQFEMDLPGGKRVTSAIDVLTHFMQLMGATIYSDQYEEADDLIASFIRANPDDIHIIISSDKDFFQLLVNPKVVVYRPGSSGSRILDAEASEKHWSTLQKGKHPAVPATGVRMFKTLCGDQSDTIPGIPRLRKKVAAVISESETLTLDELKNMDWPGFSDLERQRARGMFDRLKLNWELVGLKDDIILNPLRMGQDLEMANELAKTLDIMLDLSFLLPSSNKLIVADVPAQIFDNDWTATI
jgi:5'-3' exonuclease